jgi:hypothetical protein
VQQKREREKELLLKKVQRKAQEKRAEAKDKSLAIGLSSLCSNQLF